MISISLLLETTEKLRETVELTQLDYDFERDDSCNLPGFPPERSATISPVEIKIDDERYIAVLAKYSPLSKVIYPSLPKNREDEWLVDKDTFDELPQMKESYPMLALLISDLLDAVAKKKINHMPVQDKAAYEIKDWINSRDKDKPYVMFT